MNEVVALRKVGVEASAGLFEPDLSHVPSKDPHL